jgi:hypothetical protein
MKIDDKVVYSCLRCNLNFKTIHIMSKPILLSLFIGLVFSFLSCKDTSTEDHQDHWQSLFNGKDLSGWLPKIRGEALGKDSLNTFQVKNGAIVVNYDNYEKFDNRFGHLFYKAPFSDYRLKLKYRFVGEQAPGGEGWGFKNSGIMLHCQDPKSMSINQPFPNSLEAQFLGGIVDTVPRPTGNLCTPGTHVNINGKQIIEHCITADAPTIYGEEWVDVEVEVYGDSLIRHYINGKPAITYTNPVYDTPEDSLNHLKPVKSGYISLQSESHPIEFKEIKYMALKP